MPIDSTTNCQGGDADCVFPAHHGIFEALVPLTLAKTGGIKPLSEVL